MGLTFLAPFFLVAIPVFGVIAWIAYRAKGKGEPIRISTVRLLRHLKHTPQAPDKPKIPLRYLLELLFAGLIAALAAGISFGNKPVRSLIVVDRSLSTEQRIGADQTVKDLLRQQATTYFSDLDFSAVVDLVDTDSRVIALNQDERQLTEIFEKNVTQHVDELKELLSTIDLSEYDSIFIASDRPVQISGTKARIHQATYPNLPRRNIYFDANVLRNTSPTAIAGILTITGTKEIKRNSVEVPAEGTLILDTELFKRAATLNFSAASWTDDVIERDSLQIIQGQQEPLSEVTVKGVESLARLGLESLSQFQWKLFDPNKSTKNSIQLEFKSLDKNELDVATVREATNSIRIQTYSEAITGPFSSWEETSPLLRYLSPELIKSITANPVECSPLMQIDLSINGKPVLCHGVIDGGRHVVSGIPLFPFTTASGNFLRILTLNTLQWSFSDSEVTSMNRLHSESELDRSPIQAFAREPTRNKSAPVAKSWWLVIVALSLVIFDTIITFRTGKIIGKGR